jgi:hypothetical protein
LLALCLGAPMLARALGAMVFRYDDKRSEIGYYSIDPDARWRPAMSGPVPARSIKGILTASIYLKVPSSSLLVGRISPTRPIALACVRSASKSMRPLDENAPILSR